MIGSVMNWSIAEIAMAGSITKTMSLSLHLMGEGRQGWLDTVVEKNLTVIELS